MPPRKEKPVFVPDDLSKTMSPAEADREIKDFLKRLEDEFKDTPKEVMELGAGKVVDFLKGNISWADMFNLPKKFIRDMVEYGYLQFQAGRYQDAERFFKMLTVLDWNNSYYHSMMGSILQRQKRYGEALAEYTEAINLNSSDVVSLANRGEIYMQHRLFNDALADFDKVSALDPKKENKWANRARLLKFQIEKLLTKKGGEKGKAEGVRKKKGKK